MLMDLAASAQASRALNAAIRNERSQIPVSVVDCNIARFAAAE